MHDNIYFYKFQYHHEAQKVLCDVRVSKDQTVLYFPLKNSLDTVVGYRKIQAGREEEVETCGHHVAGLFSCRSFKSLKTDQAILVPSIQDVLSLSSNKVAGKNISSARFACIKK